jgi:hypothetical protein
VNIYTGDVCSWHLADITKRRADLCCWGRSKHWLGPGFPEPTFETGSYSGSQCTWKVDAQFRAARR